MNTPKPTTAEPLTPLPCSAWVSCAERMPRGDGDEWWVMVVTKWGDMAVAQKDWEQGHRRDFWHVARDYSFEISDVTHWRKLPEKPNFGITAEGVKATAHP